MGFFNWFSKTKSEEEILKDSLAAKKTAIKTATDLLLISEGNVRDAKRAVTISEEDIRVLNARAETAALEGKDDAARTILSRLISEQDELKIKKSNLSVLEGAHQQAADDVAAEQQSYLEIATEARTKQTRANLAEARIKTSQQEVDLTNLRQTVAAKEGRANFENSLGNENKVYDKASRESEIESRLNALKVENALKENK